MRCIMRFKLKTFLGFSGLLALVLFSSSVLAAGGMEGGGGSAQVAQFYKMARFFQASYFPDTASWTDANSNAIIILRTDDGDLGLWSYSLDQLLRKLTIKPVVGPLLLNGEKVDAINFPDLQEIDLDTTSWAAQDTASKYQIVIHEIIGLLRAKDSFNNERYRISELLANHSFPPFGNFNADPAKMLFIDNPFWTRTLSNYKFLGISATCIWSSDSNSKAIEFGLAYRVGDENLTKTLVRYHTTDVVELNPIGFYGLPVTWTLGQSRNLDKIAVVPAALLKQYFYGCTPTTNLRSQWVDPSYLLGNLNIDLIEIQGCSSASAGGASCDGRSEKTRRKIRIRKMTSYSPYQEFTIGLLDLE